MIDGAIPKGRRAAGLFDPYFLDETDVVRRVKKNEMEDRRVFYVAVTRATQALHRHDVARARRAAASPAVSSRS